LETTILGFDMEFSFSAGGEKWFCGKKNANSGPDFDLRGDSFHQYFTSGLKGRRHLAGCTALIPSIPLFLPLPLPKTGIPFALSLIATLFHHYNDGTLS
jgi:hypothetical protein